MTWAVNKCGGKRWRELGSGMIEVEGEGIPMVEPDDPRFPFMVQTWDNYGDLLSAAADRWDVPRSWPIAIASIETGFVSDNPGLQASIVSPAGAQGVMQIMPGTASMLGLNPSQRNVPELNIDAGVHLLRNLADGPTGPELPHIASAYNAGPGSGSDGVRCQTGRNEWNMVSDANYPRQAIEFNNSAIEYLGLGSGVKLAMVAGLGLALAGVGAAYVILTR